MGWNSSKLRSVVSQFQASVIEAIRISTSNEADVWIWHYCSNGKYSVRSGYKFYQLIKHLLARMLNVYGGPICGI